MTEVMGITELIARLKKEQIRVSLTGEDKLKISVPGGPVDGGLLEALKARREEIKAFLRSSTLDAYAGIPAAEPGPHYAVSHAQKRLWVLDHLEEQRLSYNMYKAYVIEDHLDREALAAAFRALVARHEILRTRFVVVDGVPRQQIHEPATATVPVAYFDFRGAGDPEALACTQRAVNETFDLAVAPLLRVTLLQTDDRRWIVLLVMHHIVSDGWSVRVLLREV
ncbi:MAG: hypothetical protein ICV83_30080, partial [Cytophagales bacterium]|nr:hypothetical protein [Cytophagales bacterium]